MRKTMVEDGGSTEPNCDSQFAFPAVMTGATELLTKRHFVMQEQRPGHLGDVDLVAMDPALRNLLFTDGTVTRTLEVHTLARVFVEVVSQSRAPAPVEVLSHLKMPSGLESVQRRVIIGTDASTIPVIWAESHIAPSRLPPGFLGVLDDAPDGIGQSLQQVKLESWRELLWFGLDTAPAWSGLATATETTVLKRLYRVITNGRPALLISESFAVECCEGSYRLNWLR